MGDRSETQTVSEELCPVCQYTPCALPDTPTVYITGESDETIKSVASASRYLDAKWRHRVVPLERALRDLIEATQTVLVTMPKRGKHKAALTELDLAEQRAVSELLTVRL